MLCGCAVQNGSCQHIRLSSWGTSVILGCGGKAERQYGGGQRAEKGGVRLGRGKKECETRGAGE